MVQFVPHPLAGGIEQFGKSLGTGIEKFFERQKEETKQRKQAAAFDAFQKDLFDPETGQLQDLDVNTLVKKYADFGKAGGDTSKLAPIMSVLGGVLKEQTKAGGVSDFFSKWQDQEPSASPQGVGADQAVPGMQVEAETQAAQIPRASPKADELVDVPGFGKVDPRMISDALAHPSEQVRRWGEGVQKSLLEQRKLSEKQTGPFKLDLAKKATEARKAIQNKKTMVSLIEKGDLTHPLIAQVAEYLPKGIGNMLLSEDAQLYRSVLFDEFGIIKSMFPGQIRTKEIELLEDKLADLFKSNKDKKAILKN